LPPQGIQNLGPEHREADEEDRWFAPWFAAGRSYHYLGSDGARGTGTTLGPYADGGWNLAASVKLDPDEEKNSDGLLTNFPLRTRPGAFASPASTRQVQLCHRIARGVLLRHGVAANLAKKALAGVGNPFGNIQPVVYALPAHDRTPATIVSSFSWNNSDDAIANGQQPSQDVPFAGFTLTLILEADSAQRYHTSHVIFQRADSESAMSYYHFFAAADIDGDGQDEIILAGSGYEWWWYEVFGKRKESWKSLAYGGGGGV
jgi:hypothetical protein